MKKLLFQFSLMAILLASGLQILRYILTVKYDFQEYFLFLLGIVFLLFGILGAPFFNPTIYRVQPIHYKENESINPLTKAEKEVMKLLLKGYSNTEIANQRCVSLNTIKTQISSIYAKLEVKNRVALLAKKSELHH